MARLRRLSRVCAALVCTLAGACGGTNGPVTRLVEGRTMEGPSVSADAYAAFLRGAVAQEEGRYGEALAAFEQVIAMDPGDPEPWARVASVRCALRPGDPGGARAALHALALDPDYAPAHLAAARCGSGDVRASVERSALAAPLAAQPQLWLARLDGAAGQSERAHERLLALALREPNAAVLDALGSWAYAHGAPRTAAHAWADACARDATRVGEAFDRAADLAGDGEIDAARTLAGALVDLRSPGLGDGRKAAALARRLAVDEALARGDAARACARAATARMSLDEVAGRAIVLGRPEIARPIAQLVADADPASDSARLALIAAKEALGEPVSFPSSRRASVIVAPSVRLAYARAMERCLGPAEAARAMLGVGRAAARAGDALEVTLAVDLTARGVLQEDELPPDGRLELASRRRVRFEPTATEAGSLDARHRLLWLAWISPAGGETARLAARLTRSGNRDPLVVASALHIASATKAVLDPRARERLAASAPADPLVCAADVEIAPTERSRRRLAAVAATGAEHALASY